MRRILDKERIVDELETKYDVLPGGVISLLCFVPEKTPVSKTVNLVTWLEGLETFEHDTDAKVVVFGGRVHHSNVRQFAEAMTEAGAYLLKI